MFRDSKQNKLHNVHYPRSNILKNLPWTNMSLSLSYKSFWQYIKWSYFLQFSSASARKTTQIKRNGIQKAGEYRLRKCALHVHKFNHCYGLYSDGTLPSNCFQSFVRAPSKNTLFYKCVLNYTHSEALSLAPLPNTFCDPLCMQIASVYPWGFLSFAVLGTNY